MSLFFNEEPALCCGLRLWMGHFFQMVSQLNNNDKVPFPIGRGSPLTTDWQSAVRGDLIVLWEVDVQSKLICDGDWDVWWCLTELTLSLCGITPVRNYTCAHAGNSQQNTTEVVIFKMLPSLICEVVQPSSLSALCWLMGRSWWSVTTCFIVHDSVHYTYSPTIHKGMDVHVGVSTLD